MAAAVQIEVPAAARELCALARVDYEDAFLVDVGPTGERPAVQWARDILEGAPVELRDTLRSGWTSLGIELDEAPPERSLLGWEIRRSTADHVVLGAGARIALTGELLFLRQGNRILYCTFVLLDGDRARGMWARVEPHHVRLVGRLLEAVTAAR